MFTRIITFIREVIKEVSSVRMFIAELSYPEDDPDSCGISTACTGGACGVARRPIVP